MPPMRALLALVGVLAWTITPYSALMPIYAKDIYGGGPHTLGCLLAAAGAGALSEHVLSREPRTACAAWPRSSRARPPSSGVALAAFAYVRIYPSRWC